MEDTLLKLIERAIGNNTVEFLEVRIHEADGTDIRAIDGRTREVSSYAEIGAAIRAFINGSYGFTSVNDIDSDSLETALNSAIKRAKFAGLRRNLDFLS